MIGTNTDCSAMLWPLLGISGLENTPDNSVQADESDSSLFYQSMSNNGSIARAMSTLVTTLSSMAYYDNMPQFQTTDNVTQVFFVTTLFPQSRRGFTAVLTVLAIHVLLVGGTTVAFAQRSQYTLLGNYWQAIAQLHSPETENLISESSMATDKEVKKRLKANGRSDLVSSVGTLDKTNGVGISVGRPGTK